MLKQSDKQHPVPLLTKLFDLSAPKVFETSIAGLSCQSSSLELVCCFKKNPHNFREIPTSDSDHLHPQLIIRRL